ncbi:hypothetical protein [[Mycobacterium] vasticus]|uniref:Uncharacterized protein n=1 Tax=[Mycobacterium] vasticus TaxID=2875777 RepID=A0ABU5Z005_9MYCO|nr:hypothetical protein [Mycolicibacter sp. MYC017]MEB3070716.1 hypothetical protein [Mycolicibacter sp. MYC017]
MAEPLSCRKVELRDCGNTEHTWDREAAGIVVTRQSGDVLAN